MKNQKLLTFSLVLFISFGIKAQSIDPSSEWRVNFSSGEPGYMHWSQYRDFIDGDTLINDMEYLKIYQSGYSYTELVPPGWYSYFEHVLHGFLREENNKWYTYYEDQDQLLFDFTLNVGDTVYSACTQYNMGPILVSGVDSVMVDGEYKRRLHLYNEEWCTDYLIEDIGATSGLFENMYFFEWESELVCFAKDGVSLWGESTEECDLAVGFREEESYSVPLIIYPNPASERVNICFPENESLKGKEYRIEFISIFGVKVKEVETPSVSEYTLLVNDLASGVYLMNILEGGKLVHSGKVMVRR